MNEFKKLLEICKVSPNMPIQEALKLVNETIAYRITIPNQIDFQAVGKASLVKGLRSVAPKTFYNLVTTIDFLDGKTTSVGYNIEYLPIKRYLENVDIEIVTIKET